MSLSIRNKVFASCGLAPALERLILKMIVFLWLLFYIGVCSANNVLEHSKSLQNNSAGNYSSVRTNRTISTILENNLHKNRTIGLESNYRKSKSPKFKQRKRIKEKQFLLPNPILLPRPNPILLPRPRPTFPFGLSPAALLIPAIPTLVGKVCLL